MKIRLALIALTVFLLPSNFAFAQKSKNALCGERLMSDSARDACIETQDKEIDRLSKALAFAWKVIEKPLSVLDAVVDFSEARASDSGIHRWAPSMLSQIDFALDGARNGDYEYRYYGSEASARSTMLLKARKEMWRVLRARYADPKTLIADMENGGAQWVFSTIKSQAAAGQVVEFLKEVSFVLEKPIDIGLARDAQEWLLTICAEEYTDTKDYCDKGVTALKQKFTAYYPEKELSGNAAWVLGFLQRREREGQKELVEAWQKIMLGVLGKLTNKFVVENAPMK